MNRTETFTGCVTHIEGFARDALAGLTFIPKQVRTAYEINFYLAEADSSNPNAAYKKLERQFRVGGVDSAKPDVDKQQKTIQGATEKIFVSYFEGNKITFSVKADATTIDPQSVK